MSVQYKTPTLFSDKYEYPVWAEGIGWGIVFICIILIPAWFFAVYMRRGGWEASESILIVYFDWRAANQATNFKKKSSTLPWIILINNSYKLNTKVYN